MLSINMRIFKTVLLIASFGASVHCLPIGGESTESLIETSALNIPSTIATSAAPTSAHLDTDYYDQRQNGSENYRIHVDGVVFVFAPVEALLLASAAGVSTTESNVSINFNGSAQTDSGELTTDKPANDIHNKTEPAISKMIQRPALRLVNLLTPLLRRVHHEHSTNVH